MSTLSDTTGANEEKKLPWWAFAIIFGVTALVAVIVYFIIYKRVIAPRRAAAAARQQLLATGMGVAPAMQQQFGGRLRALLE